MRQEGCGRNVILLGTDLVIGTVSQLSYKMGKYPDTGTTLYLSVFKFEQGGRSQTVYPICTAL